MTVHLHVLRGCSPAPLSHYLKALGLFRLVGQQADGEVRGWWEGEHFHLLTRLSREELESFLLERYEPTPLLSPWNKGCGFFKPNDPGLTPLERSRAPRFECFRRGVADARQLSDALADADAVVRAIKARTKTNMTFQSETQRQLLDRSEAYRTCLEQLHGEMTNPELADDKRAGVEDDIAIVKSLVLPAERPPRRPEAESIKNSTGYKRLLAAADRRFKTVKATLIPNCQRQWRGPHSDWLAAAVVLDEDGRPLWPSLLGTGGNDGNLDFTNNFMQHVGALFELADELGGPTSVAKELLGDSLWMEPTNKLTDGAVGQYQPGSAGGPNTSTGFSSSSRVNSWDYVLMMEGCPLFTARATRRLDSNTLSRASAPFAVRHHAAGFATPGGEKAQRGEQWMPLWKQPATLGDVMTMFGEARVQLGRAVVNSPVDAVRAISRFGVARGIETFVRYGYLERNGQSTLAVPLGRVHVRHHPRAHLVDDLASWMERVRRLSRHERAPARLVHAERRLADTVFAALTHDYTPHRWRAILDAAVAIESLQAAGTAIEAGPVPPLRPEWASAVDDGSAEARLALALGSAAAGYRTKAWHDDPVRHHWLPLQARARQFRMVDKRLVNDPRVVAFGRDPIRDLGAVVERRLIEAGMKGLRRSRLVAAPGCAARLDDLARFLSDTLDLHKLLGLARAFMAIGWNQWTKDVCPRTAESDEVPDEGWLAIRLACLPWPLTPDKDLPADLRAVRLLLSADSARAIDIARTRLRSVGIRPPLQGGVTDDGSARRWAAALAFPIGRRGAMRATTILDPSMKGLPHARSRPESA